MSRNTITRRTWIAAAGSLAASGAEWPPAEVRVTGGLIDVQFAPGDVPIGRDAVIEWIHRAARAVVQYFGRFPVRRAEVRVHPVAERSGAFRGTTYPGSVPSTRISVGSRVSRRQLERDWIMTHELVHLACPSLRRRHHWLEEGMATYVEPIARLQAGQLPAGQVWGDMMAGMPKGQPEAGDRGLDLTPTWGRTYWGGAIFCLLADIEIRSRTSLRMGLQDALRGLVAAGGTIVNDWSIGQTLRTADSATGYSVLAELYDRMAEQPYEAELDRIWERLGVQRSSDGVLFDDSAPLAAVRHAIERDPG